MGSDFDRKVDAAANKAINNLGFFLKNFFKGVFYGAKNLKDRKILIGFIITILLMVGALIFKRRILSIESFVWRYFIYFGLLISPLLYLKSISGIGMKLGNELIKRLEDYKFYGVDGKLPIFLGEAKDDFGMEVLKFQGAIPLKKWKASREDLESLFNRTIVSINQDISKDRVVLRTIPGTVEIPKRIDWSDDYIKEDDGVVVVGKNALGEISFDLNKTPHVLSAGETGSGKSVILRAMLWQLLNKGCIAYMIDFKGGVEFGKAYEKFGQVITEKEVALEVLKMLTEENKKRLDLFRELEVKNLKEYNKKTKSNLCRVAVVIDELAELLDKTGVGKEDKEILEGIEKELSTLARLSRATGINLLLGVQRPDAKVITGQIKTNVPVRICGRFADNSASEIVLSNTKAKDLQDIKGRFLIKVGADTEEFQAYYFDDEKHLKNINRKVGTLLIESEEDIKCKSEQEEASEEDSVVNENLKAVVEADGIIEDEFESGEIDWDSVKKNRDNIIEDNGESTYGGWKS